jgi:hypothetical protein
MVEKASQTPAPGGKGVERRQFLKGASALMLAVASAAAVTHGSPAPEPRRPKRGAAVMHAPADAPEGHEYTVTGVAVTAGHVGRGLRRGDVCVIHWGTPPRPGGFAAVVRHDGAIILGTFRRARGLAVTVRQHGRKLTLQPGEYLHAAGVSHVERGGEILKRFDREGGR